MKHLLRLPLMAATRRPKTVVVVSLMLLLLSFISISRLGMDASYLSLLPESDRLVQSYRKVIRHVGQINGITVLAKAKSPHELLAFTKDFIEEVNKEESVVVRFFWPAGKNNMGRIPLNRNILEKMSSATPPEFNSSFQGFILWSISLWDHLLSSSGLSPTEEITIEQAINPLIDLLSETPREETSLAISVTPIADGLNVDVLKGTYAIVHNAAGKAASGRDVTWGLTGIAALAHDEERLLMSEVFRLGTAAFIIILLIFIWFSGSFRLIPVVFLPLIAGTVVGLGVYGCRTANLNMVTAVFPVMILGLGIDYALYLISEIASHHKKGTSLSSALCRAYLICVRPIAASALTTAAAFFALSFANFAGIAELGYLAGITIIAIALATLTLLPLLVSTFLSECKIREVKGYAAGVSMGSHRFFLFISVIALLCYGATLCTYDDDLLAVQPQTLPSRIVQKELGNSGLAESVIIFCPPERKDEISTYFEKTLGFSVISLSLSSRDVSLLTEGITGILRTIRNLEQAPGLTADQMRPLLESLHELQLVHNEAYDLAFAAGLPLDDEAAETTSARLEELIKTCSTLPSAAKIDARMKTLFSSIRVVLESLTLPGGLVSIFQRITGENKKFVLLFAQGNRSLWHGGTAQNINQYLVREDLTATGPVLIFQRLAEIVRADVWRAVFLATFAVCATLLLTFRNLRMALAALAPLLIGYLSMASGLGFLGIPVTIGNVAAFPLLFGMGIDYGIHVVERTRVSNLGIRILGKNGLDRAMFVAAATTLTGFLALSCSQHPGLSSFGKAVAFGIAGSAITARLISPLLLPAASTTAKKGVITNE